MGDYNFELDLNTRNTMSIINGWIQPESKVLEFGAANGRLTRYLRETRHCSVTIVEIDEESGKEAAKYANEAYIGKNDGDIEKYNWKRTGKKYDAIVFADVLEHLSDPKMVLGQCREFLAEDGEVLVSIPNIAHNSILIGLFNDRFDYDRTGLLDHTHIHFFTHKTFAEMARNAGFYIYQTEPVYSRVGNNEIHNTYEDVPGEVNSALRRRNSGSIYQYVYRLGKTEGKKNDTIKYEEIDYYEEQESACFWLDRGTGEAHRERAESVLYEGRPYNRLSFPVNETRETGGFRWDPMEHSCVILVEHCEAVLKNGSRIALACQRSNAELKFDVFYVFETEDPQMFYEFPGDLREATEINISFYLVKVRVGAAEKWKEVRDYLEQVCQKFDDARAKSQLDSDTITQLYQDVDHRERDIAVLKEEVGRRERDIEELKGEVAHRERDISVLKEEAAHREKDIVSLQEEAARFGEQTLSLQRQLEEKEQEKIAQADLFQTKLEEKEKENREHARYFRQKVDSLTEELYMMRHPMKRMARYMERKMRE